MIGSRQQYPEWRTGVCQGSETTGTVLQRHWYTLSCVWSQLPLLSPLLVPSPGLNLLFKNSSWLELNSRPIPMATLSMLSLAWINLCHCLESIPNDWKREGIFPPKKGNYVPRRIMEGCWAGKTASITSLYAFWNPSSSSQPCFALSPFWKGITLLGQAAYLSFSYNLSYLLSSVLKRNCNFNSLFIF